MIPEFTSVFVSRCVAITSVDFNDLLKINFFIDWIIFQIVLLNKLPLRLFPGKGSVSLSA